MAQAANVNIEEIVGVDFVLQTIGFDDEEEREGLVVVESEFVSIPIDFRLILVTTKSGHRNG